jgi:hypothetical protein
MAVHNYYFLVAGLPDLTIDQGKLQFGSVEFREYLRTQLHRKDYELIEWLFLPADHQNLIQLLTKEEKRWNSTGIYTREELELAIAEIVAPDKILDDNPANVKPYIKEFIVSYFNENRLMPEMLPENELTSLYFNNALKVNNKYLKEWFEFEVNLKNVLIYNTAQKYNLPYEHDIVGNTALGNLFRQKIGRDISEAAEWKYFEAASQLSDNGTNSNNSGLNHEVAAREKAIDFLRWSVLDEMNIFNYFSIEVIISYMIKLMIIERWLKLEPKTGEELFRRLLGDLQSGYEFPNEFSLNNGKK